MKKRVVITGIGAITPVGNTVDEYWDSLKEGKHGFGPITQFDASAYKCKLVGEVKNFVAKDYIDPKSARRMARFTQFAVKATQEAMADSGLDMTKKMLTELVHVLVQVLVHFRSLRTHMEPYLQRDHFV